MFPVTTHDFGTVASNAKAEYKFKFSNKYIEDIHISGAQATCGCTTVTISKSTLKTYETGVIHAKFNTDSHRGHQSATITVTIDQPLYAEVQLSVYGNIRGDVLFTPGLVQLGSVPQGEASGIKKIHVNYSGHDKWKITDIRNANKYLKVTMQEQERQYGSVSYELKVHLKEDAPVGYVNSQLLLVTNDSQATKIPLPVEGRVVAPVVASPDILHFGTLEPGESATKQIIVRGKHPLTITRIECSSKSTENTFTYKTPPETKLLHFVPITFTAGQTPGKFTQEVLIHTDLGNGKPVTIVTSATIRKPN